MKFRKQGARRPKNRPREPSQKSSDWCVTFNRFGSFFARVAQIAILDPLFEQPSPPPKSVQNCSEPRRFLPLPFAPTRPVCICNSGNMHRDKGYNRLKIAQSRGDPAPTLCPDPARMNTPQWKYAPRKGPIVYMFVGVLKKGGCQRLDIGVVEIWERRNKLLMLWNGQCNVDNIFLASEMGVQLGKWRVKNKSRVNYCGCFEKRLSKTRHRCSRSTRTTK